MGGFLVAWLVGLSLHIAQGASEWKYVTTTNNFPLTFASPLPPKPGQILIVSGIYLGLAILAENPSFRSTATLVAWGYNIAIGLAWAQNYAAEKGYAQQSNGTTPGPGTFFWMPPTASGDTVFPTGTAAGNSTSPVGFTTVQPRPGTGGTVGA